MTSDQADQLIATIAEPARRHPVQFEQFAPFGGYPNAVMLSTRKPLIGPDGWEVEVYHLYAFLPTAEPAPVWYRCVYELHENPHCRTQRRYYSVGAMVPMSPPVGDHLFLEHAA